MPRSLRPYRQGDLDSLCGVYAIVNAMRLLLSDASAFGPAQAHELFWHLCTRGKARSAVDDGLETAEVWALATRAAAHVRRHSAAEVHLTRPFRRAGHRSFSSLSRHFAPLLQGEGTALLLAFEGRRSHWSVATGVTDHYLRVFDSAGMRRVRLDLCRLVGERTADEATHWLIDTDALMLMTRR